MEANTYILGAGVTGLAAGISTKYPILESAENPGGLCSSYYMRPGDTHRYYIAENSEEFYRFETGGGHWIFGGDEGVLKFIQDILPVKFYERRSAVYLKDRDLIVPYPIQDNLHCLSDGLRGRIFAEIHEASLKNLNAVTMQEYFLNKFGPTLCGIFFEPFHELYTSGLWQKIAFQDAYKSPSASRYISGNALNNSGQSGYNSIFVYPVNGLGGMVYGMSTKCRIIYNKMVIKIDLRQKLIYCKDGSKILFDKLLSTLPLNKMMEFTNLSANVKSDPYTSVLVINIGAIKGPRCPMDHWVYISDSESGFHRVGFYSNVDRNFLPVKSSDNRERVGIYVEKAFIGGGHPTEEQIWILCNSVIREIQGWGWISEVEVMDPTWIEVAYTWVWPGSVWRVKALEMLGNYGIYQIGRFARWNFQGISASIREGLDSGKYLAGKVPVLN